MKINYPPQTKLREGNVSEACVKNFVHRGCVSAWGGCLVRGVVSSQGVSAQGCVCPGRVCPDTPKTRGKHLPSLRRWPLKWAVRILLECIPVFPWLFVSQNGGKIVNADDASCALNFKPMTTLQNLITNSIPRAIWSVFVVTCLTVSKPIQKAIVLTLSRSLLLSCSWGLVFPKAGSSIWFMSEFIH